MSVTRGFSGDRVLREPVEQASGRVSSEEKKINTASPPLLQSRAGGDMSDHRVRLRECIELHAPFTRLALRAKRGLAKMR